MKSTSTAAFILSIISTVIQADKIVDITFDTSSIIAGTNTHIPEYTAGTGIESHPSVTSFESLRTRGHDSAKLMGVDIGPGPMPNCTLMIGLKADRIGLRVIPAGTANGGGTINPDQGNDHRSIEVAEGIVTLMAGTRFNGIWADPQLLRRVVDSNLGSDWVYITAVFRQGGQSYVFIDGIRSTNDVATTNNIAGSPDLYIGSRPPHYGFNGWIKNVKVYDEALDDGAVLEETINFHNTIPYMVQPMPQGIPTIIERQLQESTVSPTKEPTISPTTSELNFKIIDMNMASFNDSYFSLMYKFIQGAPTLMIRNEDCVTNSTGTFPITSVSVSVAGEMVTQYNVKISPGEIENSNLWSPTPDNLGGIFAFCARLELTASSHVVSYIETIYNIQIDLTSEFDDLSIGFDIQKVTFNRNIVMDYDVKVVAYQCKDNGDKVDNPPVLSNGQLLAMCVSIKDDEFDVKSFRALTVKQDGVTNPSSVNYITNGNPNRLVRIKSMNDPSGQKILHATVQLVADFFGKDNTGALDVTGSIIFEVTNRQRKLTLAVPTFRALQTDNDGASFDLTVGVIKDTNSAAPAYLHASKIVAVGVLASTGLSF